MKYSTIKTASQNLQCWYQIRKICIAQFNMYFPRNFKVILTYILHQIVYATKTITHFSHEINEQKLAKLCANFFESNMFLCYYYYFFLLHRDSFTYNKISEIVFAISLHVLLYMASQPKVSGWVREWNGIEKKKEIEATTVYHQQSLYSVWVCKLKNNNHKKRFKRWGFATKSISMETI